uniref:KN homeodomain domain-containing protein n=1 Tax=Timema bartmani TaxID=61472 RepID=A0A7R9EQD2_9NEOP|nr:unnamed protein product [Timema bartmani]
MKVKSIDLWWTVEDRSPSDTIQRMRQPLQGPYSLPKLGTQQVAKRGSFVVHSYGAGYDLAARRKNATRESTATLKAWLNEHKKNPYPTKGEKIMLAIITKIDAHPGLHVVRQRAAPPQEGEQDDNKTDDDDDAIVSDSDEKDKDDLLMNGDKLKDSRMRDDKVMGTCAWGHRAVFLFHKQDKFPMMANSPCTSLHHFALGTELILPEEAGS